MSFLLARHQALITGAILLVTTLILLAPALRPGYVLLAADLPYRLDPLWQPLAPPGAANGANPVLGDQFYQFYAWQRAAWQLLRQGELPTWNPAINGGQPLFGNGLAGILSPFNLAGGLLPANLANVVSALLRLWVAGAFTYLYARTTGLSLASSWLAMLVFTFGGPLISWLWGAPSHVLVCFPLLLWTGEKLLITRHLRWALASSLALALLILGGQPEVAFQSGSVWALYLLCRATWLEGGLWQGVRRHFKWWLLVAALGLGLAAVEILGFVDALTESVILHNRQGLEARDLSAWLRSLFFNWQEWPTLVTMLLPRFLGREVDESYWYPIGNSVENNTYAGVLPLLLALLACWSAWRGQTGGARRWIWLWTAFAASLLAVATGLPLAAGVHELPLFNLTILSRMRGHYLFAVAILAGFGLDCLLSQSSLRRPLIVLLVAAAVANLVLVAAAYFYFTRNAEQLMAAGRAFMASHAGSPALDRPLDELYALVETRQAAKVAMLRPSNPIMYLPLLVAGVVMLLLWLHQKGRIRQRWLIPALLTIAWLDLLWVNTGVNSTVPAEWLTPVPPAISYLQQQPGPFRVVGTNLILNPNMSMLTQLEDVRGYDALEPYRYRQLLAGLDGFTAAGYHTYLRHLDDPRLDLFNAEYGLSRTPPSNARWDTALTDPGGVTLYRSRTALPRAYLVYAAQIVTNAEESLARTLDPSFDPRQSVVLEESPAGWHPPDQAQPDALPVEFSQRRATSEQLVVDTPVPALLVLLESYSPGWRATIDQQPTPIYAANHAFRAVVVPAGEHTIAFHYAPPLLIVGAAISLGTVVLFALVFLLLLFWSRSASYRQRRIP